MVHIICCLHKFRSQAYENEKRQKFDVLLFLFFISFLACKYQFLLVVMLFVLLHFLCVFVGWETHSNVNLNETDFIMSVFVVKMHKIFFKHTFAIAATFFSRKNSTKWFKNSQLNENYGSDSALDRRIPFCLCVFVLSGYFVKKKGQDMKNSSCGNGGFRVINN